MIDTIVYNKTSNIFLNSGIIGLYIYLKKCKKKIAIDYKFKLEENKLIVKSDKLMDILEFVYYEMGKEFYDTSNKKQLQEKDKYFFIREPFQAIAFGKMSSFGLSGLITKPPLGPQPLPRNENNAVYFKRIIESDQDFANKISRFYFENNLKIKYFDFDEIGNPLSNSNQDKGDSRIFLNEPYTKTTPLPKFDKLYFEAGEETCHITGNNYKKLIEPTSTSPFLSGLMNFESFGNNNSRRLSWEALYLSRFSPVLAFYIYTEGLNKIACYFFQSDNLINTYRLYNTYKSLFLTRIELIEKNYMSNFKMLTFDNQKKDSEVFDVTTDFVWQNEILFILLYSFYRSFLYNKNNEKTDDDNDFEPVKRYDEFPISLIYFRSDSFASTMRPQLFEEFNNYKFIISLFKYFEEKEEIKLDSKKMLNFLQSLKYIKDSERSSVNKYSIERKIRNQILKDILSIKSILEDVRTLFFNCFSDLISGSKSWYRDYNLIFNIAKYYEKIILFGGDKNMNEELQEKAIKLGTSIGMGIINYDSPQNKTDRETNIKGGRKYIISFNKARTLQQFLNEIVRIQTRYGMVVSEDLLKGVSENNWEYIRSFCIIKTLSVLNSELQFKKQENNEGVK